MPLRYRVHKTILYTEERWIITDTKTKEPVSIFDDPMEAHIACGNLNYKHKLELATGVEKLNDFA